MIVTGGPGTGKSVIAVRLVGWGADEGLNVSHATGSKSFTETMRQVVGRRAGQIFRYFNQFGQAHPDELDLLVCDEAHRIRVSSNSRYTRREARTDLPQVDELIQVARVPVFLLDENQVVRPEEIGTVDVIRDAARRNGAEIIEVELNGQFRCMGSEAYIAWVERLLGLTPGAPIPWDDEDDFELGIADSPAALEAWLATKNGQGWTGRLAAGFCWRWSDPQSDGTLVDDVEIGEWRRPWNVRQGKKAKDAPSASFWATDPRGFGQVGCIYTAQGFEYDFNGVIMGPDLVWRENRWASDASSSKDTVARRAPNFDALVRNVYKVLLTRGLRGCGIFSTDPETQELLIHVVPTRI